MEITVDLVQTLVREQFPQWGDLPVYPVAKSGHDNRTFHLGEKMAVRLPSGEGYAGQVMKENRWLPYLQRHLDYPISQPIAVGSPAAGYPFSWSVNVWLEGETVADSAAADKNRLAGALARALKQLQAVDCSGGPEAGPQNYYRGGDLRVYQPETLAALEGLKDSLPAARLREIWDRCLSTVYTGPAVWVHGDVAPGNILLREGRFYALIDFGVLGTGDPACDYAMAWTYFDQDSRGVFLEGLPVDMIQRARGWALWKALITCRNPDPALRENATHTLEAILREAAG